MTYMSRISDVGSLDTNGKTAASRKYKCFGASVKANETPARTIFRISDLCLFRAAPMNVPESRVAKSLQSE